MSPPRPDAHYALYAGLATLIAAALLVLAAIAGAARLDDGTPQPSTYIVGPDGDNVTITPRAAP